jgi:ComF family protein
MLYKDTARRLVIAFKHGDRLDLQRPLGEWVAHAAAPLLVPGMLVAPVPLHRWRLLKRRYNQSALLAQVVANKAGLTYTPDLLQRTRSTPSQLGRNKDQRFENISGAIHINPKKCAALIGRAVLIVDDVLTSGATLAACANACRNAGAETVSVVVLARVAKDA